MYSGNDSVARLEERNLVVFGLMVSMSEGGPSSEMTIRLQPAALGAPRLVSLVYIILPCSVSKLVSVLKRNYQGFVCPL